MSSVPGGIEVGTAAPPLQVSEWLNSSPGKEPDLAQLRGKVVVLHAFQMLCPGCVSHGLPQAQRIAAACDPAEVLVIGLHSVFEHHAAMRPLALRAFVHEYRWGFPIAIDQHCAQGQVPLTMQAYGMRGTPTLILIDRRGMVRCHWFGRPSDMEVGMSIGMLLGQPSPFKGDVGEQPAASLGCAQGLCPSP